MNILQESIRQQQKERHTQIQIANIDFFESLVTGVIDLVRTCEGIEDVQPYFEILEQVQTILASLLFKKRIVLSDKLETFTRDFDRIDDTRTREYLFKKIREDSTYLKG